MKRLLRGVIDHQDGALSHDALHANWLRLEASNIDWLNPVDERVFRFVREFVLNHGEQPVARVVTDYFDAANDIEVIERMKDVAAAPVFARASFGHVISQIQEEQRRLSIKVTLSEAGAILSKGKEVTQGRKKVRLQGSVHALDFLSERLPDLYPAASATKTRGDLRDAVGETLEAYQAAKRGTALGVLTGINTIDVTCLGAKPGELWIHAGFAGEMKSSFALNWSLNAVTRYRTNVLYVSLEMPYAQIRRMVHVMHSATLRWAREGRQPLDYRKVRDGDLDDEQEEFMNVVLRDFEPNPEHCRFQVWAPDRDVSIADVRGEAQRLQKTMDVGLIIIDHSGLLRLPSSRDDYTVKLNAEIREAKKLALQFDGGRGVPVVLLHQLNREGKKQADKDGGRLGLHALSYANEAEKSADIVTTTYLNDQLREDGEVLVSNLKNRENPLFKPLKLSVDWTCRKVFEDRAKAAVVSDISDEEFTEAFDAV